MRCWVFGALFLVFGSCAGCASKTIHEGYIPKSQAVREVKVGMPQSETRRVLGSPSITTALEGGASDYYISSTKRKTIFSGIEEEDRKVLALRFNHQNKLVSVANYGLENGRVIDFNHNTTPTSFEERSILSRIFGNLTPNPLPMN